MVLALNSEPFLPYKIIMRNIFREFIPKRIRLKMQRVYYFPADTIDLLLGRRDELTPPKGMIFCGGGDFKKTGEGYLQHFMKIGGLQPNEKVLDVGCGIGRVAVPLTKYLRDEGRYEGFDIVAAGINWCKKKITPRYPNFHFRLVDVYNKMYNPKGKYKAREYKFPYANESFDFIFLTSVFTHMRPQDMENYFFEIARVMKKDGRCLISFFLLNAESLKLIDAELNRRPFKYNFGEYRTINKNIPESMIAYDDIFIRRIYKKSGLRIREPIYYGSWCGRKKFLSDQDIIIATKK